MKQPILLFAALLALQLGCSSSKKSSSRSDASKAAKVEGEEKGEIIVSEGSSESFAGTLGPTVQFIAPKADTEVEIGVLEIQVEFLNLENPNTAEWSLYYATGRDAVEDANAIVTDLPVGTKKVEWLTSFVDNGTYEIFATLVDGESESNHWLSFPVTFDEDHGVLVGGTPGAPTINLTLAADSPFDGDVERENGTFVLDQLNQQQRTQTISWAANDPNGDDYTVSVSYSTDAGQTWTNLAENLPVDQNSFDWEMPTDLPRSGAYKLRVTASNDAGSNNAETRNTFGVTPTAVTFADVQQIFQDNCVGCHTPGNTSGDLDLSAETNADQNINGAGDGNAPRDAYRRTRRPSRGNQMPPAADLSAADQGLIYLYYMSNR